MKNRKNIVALCILILTSLVSIIFFGVFSEKHSRKILGQLSQQEREDLKSFCEYLMKETEFGYTLFGTKPVTLLSLQPSEKTSFDMIRSLYDNAIPIVEKVIPKLKLKKYQLSIHKHNEDAWAFFINKDAFSRIFNENRSIFEQFGCIAANADALLTNLSKSGDFEKTACNNHEALLGICLGYGVQNSLNAERRSEIRDFLSRQNVPPWKTSDLPGADDRDNFLKFDRYSLDKGRLPQYNSSRLMQPSDGFSSLEDELAHLRLVLQDSTELLFEDIAFVQIPLFWCDKNSQETTTLLKNYKEQQREIRKVLTSGDFLETVFDKLTEE